MYVIYFCYRFVWNLWCKTIIWWERYHLISQIYHTYTSRCYTQITILAKQTNGISWAWHKETLAYQVVKLRINAHANLNKSATNQFFVTLLQLAPHFEPILSLATCYATVLSMDMIIKDVVFLGLGLFRGPDDHKVFCLKWRQRRAFQKRPRMTCYALFLIVIMSLDFSSFPSNSETSFSKNKKVFDE